LAHCVADKLSDLYKFSHGNGRVRNIYGSVISIVTNHLLPLVRDMGAHGCQPLQGIKHILLFSVFGPVKGLGFLRNIGHSLLRKGGADDAPGQVLNGLLLTGLNSWATIHVEPGMPLAHHHADQIFFDHRGSIS